MALSNSVRTGSHDKHFAFFGMRDHYRKSGIVSVHTWEKYFGNSYMMYDGTHFMEEEFIDSLLMPKILEAPSRSRLTETGAMPCNGSTTTASRRSTMSASARISALGHTCGIWRKIPAKSSFHNPVQQLSTMCSGTSRSFSQISHRYTALCSALLYTSRR